MPRIARDPVPLTYRVSKWIGKFTFLCTMNAHVLHEEVVERGDAYLLAVTHLSHLEPFCAGILSKRKVEWISRKEFYANRFSAWYLRAVGCIKVNRQGIPVSTIRAAIQRLREGRVIGICPEGGVVCGKETAIRGGPIKRGVCSMAIRAGVPIIPCVILGTHELNRVGPWLPFKRATIWVNYGEPIHPSAGLRSTRASRQALSVELVRSYQDLYGEMLESFRLKDSQIP